MAQIIIYKLEIDYNEQNKYTVKCDNTDILLQYLQESAMIIIDSTLLSKKEIIFFKLLKLSFPIVTIADYNQNNCSESFIIITQNNAQDLVNQQLCKSFNKINKKNLLKNTYEEFKSYFN